MKNTGLGQILILLLLCFLLFGDLPNLKKKLTKVSQQMINFSLKSVRKKGS